MLFVAESAKSKIGQLKMAENLNEQYFVRVSVTSGGCSGLSYNMDFDDEIKENDQIFESHLRLRRELCSLDPELIYTLLHSL